MINDPIVVLENAVNQNLAEGFTFEGGTALNICTASEVHFQQHPNSVIIGAPPPVVVGAPAFNQFNGGAQNTVFFGRPAADSAAQRQRVDANYLRHVLD